MASRVLRLNMSRKSLNLTSAKLLISKRELSVVSG